MTWYSALVTQPATKRKPGLDFRVAARFDYGKNVGGSNQKEKSLRWLPKNIASDARLWLHPVMSPSVQVAARRRMTVFFSGHVQGVGFRYTAKTVATGFEIAGLIRNLPDSRVELVAEGNRAELEACLAALHDAGLAGFIRDEQVIWTDAKNEFRGFEIVR
jgi:acylphosphatase